MMNSMYEEKDNLCEMAIINPRLCKQLEIQVEVKQRDNGTIPHLYVYHNKTRNPKECSYIRLDRCEYSTHYDNQVLPKDLKSQFMELMNTNCPNYCIYDFKGDMHPASGYQAAVQIWANTYEDGNLDKFELDDKGIIKQIDFSKLPDKI